MFKFWRYMLLGVALMVGTAQAAVAEPIEIGVVGPFSGPKAVSGIAMKRGFQYVVNKVNQNGGVMVDGEQRKIELIFADSQTQPAIGVAAATKLLTRENVDILFGALYGTSVTMAIMDLVPSFPNTFFMTGQPIGAAIGKRIKKTPKKVSQFLERRLQCQCVR